MKKSFILLIIIFIPYTLLSNPKYTNFHNIENWYYQIAVGYAIPSYNQELQNAVDDINDLSDSHVPINLDFGFYFPTKNDQGLIGGSFNGVLNWFEYKYDRYDDEEYWFQINQYLLGPSFIYFSDYIGKGLFLRADIGVGWATAAGKDYNSSEKITTDRVVGYLFGIGWAIPFHSESRFIISINHSGRSIKSENFYATTFNIGFLF